MSEPAVKRRIRVLTEKTIKQLDKESYWCGPAKGKLAEVATAYGFDKGAFKIIKSVYGKISENELNRLLNFKEAPLNSPCLIEVWFWKIRSREPFCRIKLHYNQPEQPIDELKKLGLIA